MRYITRDTLHECPSDLPSAPSAVRDTLAAVHVSAVALHYLTSYELRLIKRCERLGLTSTACAILALGAKRRDLARTREQQIGPGIVGAVFALIDMPSILRAVPPYRVKRARA